MSTYYGGFYVARYLRDNYCAGTTKIQRALNNNWFACRWDKCWDTYVDMYRSTSDALNVRTTTGDEHDGGVQNRKCRWGTSENEFRCY